MLKVGIAMFGGAMSCYVLFSKPRRFVARFGMVSYCSALSGLEM